MVADTGSSRVSTPVDLEECQKIDIRKWKHWCSEGNVTGCHGPSLDMDAANGAPIGLWGRTIRGSTDIAR